MEKTDPIENSRTINQINDKLAAGEAVVMTASEICEATRAGRNIEFKDVDVVTAATCGLMSGTYAVLSFQFTDPNRFVKASRLFLNGIEAYPGPCPNERIGLIDAIVYGTRHSKSNPRYGGGHLFRDLVAGRRIDVEVVTESGETLAGEIDLDRIPHAVLHGSRHAFRNYVGFVNPGDEPLSTIFSSLPLPPKLGGATACGCGEINPVQKDPGLRTIGVGTRVMLNGGTGYVTGLGTRSSPERPCLTAMADMHTMSPEYMGGFQTSAGPEVIQTWAASIPILDETVLHTAKILDEEIPLIITDVKGRTPLVEATYGDLWVDTDLHFTFDADACMSYREGCPDCPPAALCPSGAFTEKRDGIEGRICCHCGICAFSCHGGCFSGDLGGITVHGTQVPFMQRLSDRAKARVAASEMKALLLKGEFRMTEPVEKIRPKS